MFRLGVVNTILFLVTILEWSISFRVSNSLKLLTYPSYAFYVSLWKGRTKKSKRSLKRNPDRYEVVLVEKGWWSTARVSDGSPGHPL